MNSRGYWFSYGFGLVVATLLNHYRPPSDWRVQIWVGCAFITIAAVMDIVKLWREP
jgi:hypothetical protein